jgi:hypothetical protein
MLLAFWPATAARHYRWMQQTHPAGVYLKGRHLQVSAQAQAQAPSSESCLHGGTERTREPEDSRRS